MPVKESIASDPVSAGNKPAKAARVKVLERRLQNPFGEESAPVRFKEKGKIGRWFNGSIVADKVWRAKNNGWSLVFPDDIADLDQIGGHSVSVTGNIVRGERGQEVLMWMYDDDFKQIQWAKTKKNMSDMKDFDKEKLRMINAAAAKFGGEAADFLNKRVGPVGGVTDSYERIERRPDEAE